MIAQTVAITNYIAKKAGSVLEGKSRKDFAMSQMLISEGEDIYNLAQKQCPTLFVSLEKKGGLEPYKVSHKMDEKELILSPNPNPILIPSHT